jgi:hypothetical protein
MSNYREKIMAGLEVNLGNAMKHNLAGYIYDNMDALPILWDTVVSASYPYNARAMWVFELICTSNDTIFNQYLDTMAAFFPISENEAVNRMIAKLLMLKDVPEKYEGEVLNTAFERLVDKKLPIAVRVNCMQIVFNLSKKYPEIEFELRGIIENEIAHGMPAFKNRGGKILQQLNKKSFSNFG